MFILDILESTKLSAIHNGPSNWRYCQRMDTESVLLIQHKPSKSLPYDPVTAGNTVKTEEIACPEHIRLHGHFDCMQCDILKSSGNMS